jgi:hypothetical protein
MTLILGLGNRARHGKDTFAKAIDAHYAIQAAAAAKHELRSYKPVLVQHHSFADALYREVNAWLKVTTQDGLEYSPRGSYMVPPDDTNGFTGRVIPQWVTPDPKPEVSARAPYGKHPKLLQWWGTEYRRAQDPLYWVKRWKDGINPKANIVMATDMRFLNEAEAVKSVGGLTVQVSRKNIDGTPFVDPSRDANHPSETQLDDYNFDYQITVKTGDLVLLEEWAMTLVHYLRALKGHK